MSIEIISSGLQTTIAKDKKVIVRVDDDSNDSRILGLVSSDYDVITHKESVEPIENVLRNMYDDSASIPTAIRWPNSFASSPAKAGSRQALVPTTTRATPASRRAEAEETSLTPPPSWIFNPQAKMLCRDA